MASRDTTPEIEMIFALVFLNDLNFELIDTQMSELSGAFTSPNIDAAFSVVKDQTIVETLAATNINLLRDMAGRVDDSMRRAADVILNAMKEQNKSRICVEAQAATPVMNGLFNHQIVDDKVALSQINVTQNCLQVDITSLLKSISSSLPELNRRAQTHYYDLTANNTIIYPYSQSPTKNKNHLLINEGLNLQTFFISMTYLFLYPCARNYQDHQLVNLDTLLNEDEQQIDYNASSNPQFTSNISLVRILKSLSQTLSKDAACYGANPVRFGTTNIPTQLGRDAAMKEFIRGSLNQSASRVLFSDFLDLLDTYLYERGQNNHYRLYKGVNPVGDVKQRRNSLQIRQLYIIMNDYKLIDSQPQIDITLNDHTNVTEEMLWKLNVNIIIITRPELQSQTKTLAKQLLIHLSSNIVTVLNSESKLLNYLQNITNTSMINQSFIFGQNLSIFNQSVLQHCYQFGVTSNVGIFCQHIPHNQLFQQTYFNEHVANYYLADGSSEMFYAMSDDSSIYDYKYFLARCDAQMISHMNSFSQVKFQLDDSYYYIGFISKFSRFLAVTSPVQATRVRQTSTFSAESLDLGICMPQCGSLCVKRVSLEPNSIIIDTLSPEASHQRKGYNIDCQSSPQQSLYDKYIDAEEPQALQFALALAAFDKDTTSRLEALWQSYVSTCDAVIVGHLMREGALFEISNFELERGMKVKFKTLLMKKFKEDYETTDHRIKMDTIPCQYYNYSNYPNQTCIILYKVQPNEVQMFFVLFPQQCQIFGNSDPNYNVFSHEGAFLYNRSNRNTQAFLFSAGIMRCEIRENRSGLHKELHVINSSKWSSAQQLIAQEFSNLRAYYLSHTTEIYVTVDCDATYDNGGMKDNYQRVLVFQNLFNPIVDIPNPDGNRVFPYIVGPGAIIALGLGIYCCFQ